MSGFQLNDDIALRIQMRNRICEKVLKRDFINLKRYFSEAVEKKNSCLVFISRRCYVLYQIIAEIENWSHEIVVTDWGLFAFKERIKGCKNVIVIDDIGLTGVSMKRVIKTVNKYISWNCRMEAMLFAINIENATRLKRIHLENFRSVKLKSYYELTNRQCQELSKKLITVILECGMPYTTFVYPIFGKECGTLIQENGVKELKLESRAFNKNKWHTTYITDFINSNFSWSEYVSDYKCVRIYREKENEKFSLVIPFLFIKSVKPNKIETLFTIFSKRFEELGVKGISTYIQDSLKVKKAIRKNAFEYLMCFFTCFCTKNLLDILDISKSMKVQEDVAINSLKGSFEQNTLNILKNSDINFSLKFWKGIDLKSISECFYSFSGSEYAKIEDLKDYVRNKKDTPVFEVTCGLFNLMRKLSDKDKKLKSIAFDEIFNLLRNEGEYDAEAIYLAQIECWDRGIATYSFEYSEKKGIIAKCCVGEMSSVIYMLHFSDLLRKFYEKNFFCEKNLTDEQRQKNLLDVIEEEKNGGRISEEEIEILYELIQGQQGGIYNLLI